MSGDDVDLGSLIRPGRVHRRLYTDPAIFELEMFRLFGQTWVYLAHTSQLPLAGDFVQVRVGRRPVLVCRAEDGTVHALLNRCSHRGTKLEVAAQGCMKRFTCPYHGWTFVNDGRLVGVPFPGNYAALDRTALGLGTVRVAEHRGFVFGSLAGDPPPLDDWLGPAAVFLDDQIDRHPDGAAALFPRR
ncbi:MAG: Rieske (2Fe-2S) protein [Ilumatobacteraceae bacterium]